MSEPATAPPVSISASGYEDGLGRRTLEFDREAGVMLERLHLRPEFGAFRPFLHDRVTRLVAFDDERFARLRGIERTGSGLSVVSQFAAGQRLCDLLEAARSLPADEASSPSVDAALGFLLEILPALGSLHASTGRSHGTLAPGHVVLTASGQVIVLDAAFGPVVERLQFNRRRLWLEFGIAMPAAAGPARFDISGDIAQASLCAMMIVVGRPLGEHEYPEGLSTLLTEVIEIAQIRGSTGFGAGLQAFLERTLPLPGRRAHAGAEEATAEVRHIAREIGAPKCRAALTSFIGDMNRVLAETREQVDGEFALAEDFADLSTSAPSSDVTSDSEFTALPYEAEPEVTELASPVTDDSGGYEAEHEVAAVVPFEEPAMAYDASMEPVEVVEPEHVFVEPIEPVVDADPAPAPAVVFEALEPLPAAAYKPEPEPEPIAAVPVPEPVVVAPPARPAAPSKRKRRGSKSQRDKLQSNTVQAAKPLPAPAPAPPRPNPVPVAAPGFGRTSDPLHVDAAAATKSPATAVARPSIGIKPQAQLRLKTEAPTGYSPAPTRGDRRESEEFGGGAYIEQNAPPEASEFPWRLAAAGVIVILIGIVSGRAYLPDRDAAAAEPVTAQPALPTKHVAVEPPKGGSVAVTTQPAGAHVLLDGKAVGDTPVTLDGLTPGKHTLTLVTSSGTVKKVVKVEAGKIATVDVAVYSGWIVVFSPVSLDIAENGRAIGTTEQGRIMLSPGRHLLSFSNRQLGYSSAQTVDIAPGEERAISVQPTGALGVNAVPWAEVWMNGKKLGDTPFSGVQVPLGTHELTFKNPQFPDRRATVTVTANAPATASVDFSK